MMKKTAATLTAIGLMTTSAYATNGDNLIGLGAKALGMGGTGIAHYNGAESATSNPALIAKSKGTQFSFGGTYFTPDVNVKTTAGGNDNNATGENATSDAKHNIIPYVVITNKLDNGFAVGVSMYGSAGMGTDWRHTDAQDGNTTAGEYGLYGMRSNLMLLKFSLPVAYGQDNWSIGAAPVIMYGSLDMSFNIANGTGGRTDVGNGSSSDLGLGYELGAAYTLPDIGVTVATRYQSTIMMEYMDQIATTGAAFQFTGANAFTDKLEQPAEYGFGIDWTSGDVSLSADWKKIQWGSAEGYRNFGWMDQNAYALGAEYRIDKLALRAGYNYAKNPISASSDGRINALNHVMFPAVTEKHYTIGAGYEFTKTVGADFAFMYATSPKVTTDATQVGLGELTVKNDQIAVAANLNYKF
jgi:long-chain fatty acid transport protein